MTKHSEKIGFWEFEKEKCIFKVIGVGGFGSNTIKKLYNKGVTDAEIIAVGTCAPLLDFMDADKKILIGKGLTRGLGCGGSPYKGREAANESNADIKFLVAGAEIVFIVAGMGGGTGTGAAPVIAQAAKESGAIVVSYITMPLKMESSRLIKAKEGLQNMLGVSDTLIVIDNNWFDQHVERDNAYLAFEAGKELVSTLIKDFVELITLPSLVGLDYADIKDILLKGKLSTVCVGESGTKNRAEESAKIALGNPLLDVTYEGAIGALITIIGGNDLTLDETYMVTETVEKSLNPSAKAVWGAKVIKEMTGKMRVAAIITGIELPKIFRKDIDGG
ncbi:MAG: cell division protein FtsZ [Nanoarchaeota archaeon]|nr:cell division protein FtsZ [Nanoarchaeota archaeon]